MVDQTVLLTCLGIAFLCGLGLGVVLATRRLHAREPTAAAPAAPMPEPGSGSLAAGLPPFPVEIHLILNVLNRVVMKLGLDEHSQDGVAALADYLSALSRLQKKERLNDARLGAAPIEAYWRLSEWQQSTPVQATFKWQSTGELARPASLWRLIDDIQQTLRGLEGLSIVGLEIDVRADPVDAPDRGQEAVVRIDATQAASGAHTAATDRALAAGWARGASAALSIDRRMQL